MLLGRMVGWGWGKQLTAWSYGSKKGLRVTGQERGGSDGAREGFPPW